MQIGGYVIYRKAPQFGDNLLAAFFTTVLIDNGIKAVYRSNVCQDLVDLPIFDYQKHKDWKTFYYGHHPPRVSMFYMATKKFRRESGYKGPLKIKRRYVPVLFTEADLPPVDITINSVSGPWSKARDWPYFPQFKAKLDRLGISWVDLNQQNIRNNDCLNYVHHSKLYLGLESGMSVYVSQIAAQKALIIQSCRQPFDYWCEYDYDHISLNLPCKGCRHHGSQPCRYNWRCMSELSVEQVLNRVLGYF